MPPKKKGGANAAAARAKRWQAAQAEEAGQAAAERGDGSEPIDVPSGSHVVGAAEQPIEQQMDDVPCGTQAPMLEEEEAGASGAKTTTDDAGSGRARLEPVRKQLRVSAKWLESNAANISELDAPTPQVTPSGAHAERRIVARFDGPIDEEQVAYEDRVCYTLPVRWRGLKSGGCCRCCCCLPLLKPLLLMPRRSILAGAAGGRRERRRGQEARRSAPRSRADGARATRCSTKEGGGGRGGGD